MSKHYLIFIHGIGELEGNDASPSGYKTLWNLLIKQSGLTTEAFNQQFGRIDVIWHDGTLYEAEKTISKTCFPNLKPGFLRPMDRLRSFMTFFIGDVAAYVSEDVNFIRRTVWEQIWQKYQDDGKSFKQLLEDGATYSIVSHSLGTVIGFDYLFDLFNPDGSKLFVPTPDFEKRPEDRHLNGAERSLSAMAEGELDLLKNGFRHFFSMGSPIALFLMRKGCLWSDENPFTTVYNPVRMEGRVWCNFWDSEDLIAYPIADLFAKNPENSECKLLDVAVETGWVFSAHVDYWKNSTVAKTILEWISASN
jgi:hypothetical protein